MEYVANKKVLCDPGKLSSKDESGNPLLKQSFIVGGICSIHFCNGVLCGAPTVLIPQLRQTNITVTDDLASWLSSAFCYAAVPWLFVLAASAHILGRKKTFIFVSLVTVIGFIAFYFCKTTTHFLLTEVVLGVNQASVPPITTIIISEYTSPKYRGTFLCLKSATFFWGIWTSNAIGTFTFWYYIPIVGFAVSLMSLSALFWPESPIWLANKNKFSECRSAHRWLIGKSENAEMQLKKLIHSQITPDEIKWCLKDITFVSRREFFIPVLLSLLVILQYQMSGKFVITLYAIDVLKTIVKEKSNVYTSMLILDAVTVFSAYVGSFISKLFKRRTILLSTSIVAISFLLILSLYLYLIVLKKSAESAYISIFLLAGFSISVCCGPMILGTSLYGELIPYKYKSIAIIIVGVEYMLLHGTLLKLALIIIKAFGIHGTFLFYALCSGFCTLLIYLYLPETKDKTLLEIEEYFRDKSNQSHESNTLVSQ